MIGALSILLTTLFLRVKVKAQGTGHLNIFSYPPKRGLPLHYNRGILKTLFGLE
jgi:hypothetical protein